MNIIYYCFAGAHASVVASAIHCGLLPADRVPAYGEFVALPYYDRTAPRLIGSPYLMGQDEYGHSVYFLGLWDQRQPLMAAAQALLATAGVDEQDRLFQDAFPLINFSTKLGGLLSKRYRLTNIGRRMTVWGMQRQYPAFVAMVADVKNRLRQ
ncbi:MAG: DUF3189 family protein [Sporomusaceae bacterium]|nr:DUF3189 family protein [Sporomusaceae bacterium]